jgi:hypothetical protein
VWSTSRSGRALPPGRDPRYPLYRRLGGPQSRSGHRGKRNNPLPLPGIEPRSPGRPVRGQTLYCLNYPPRFWILLSGNYIRQTFQKAKLSILVYLMCLGVPFNLCTRCINQTHNQKIVCRSKGFISETYKQILIKPDTADLHNSSTANFVECSSKFTSALH